ncbi:hypothetical protein BH11BAC1_BH11BAC1_25050 [soil metagenome]
MSFKKFLSLVILICCAFLSYSQNRNSNWCFGDSVGMNFSAGSPSLFNTHSKSRGSSVSVSDSIGQLLFYSFTRASVPGNTTKVMNRDNILMQNGGNIIGEGWYQELCIIPDPSDQTQYYLFSVGVTGSSQYGLYYSLIDMKQDSGRGQVVVKNIQLQNYAADDCIIAIKHADGRDWWVISRSSDNTNDEFYQYLITPSGISAATVMHVGSATLSNNYRFAFSKQGNKMISIDTQGLVELFDFDRCTGLISFDQTILPEITAGNIPYYFGIAFSPSGRFLYLSQFAVYTPNYLIQFDLQAANILNSADTVFEMDSIATAFGLLMLAPDDKIYMASAWNDSVNFNYPYPDSVFNTVNNNLSVINYPDSPETSCGFAPFSFNLGQGRCYWGLPNNPDYELGAIVNSLCDTVTQVGNLQFAAGNGELHLFYHPVWQIAFINAEKLQGINYNLSVYDVTGRTVCREMDKLHYTYYSKDWQSNELSSGMYLVIFQTEKERLVQKFIKE